ncbi:hypothetical protein A2U01_0091490, partial [Trifolium medium]|nr:hypothetical protein [Trifolium medium]
MEEDIGRGRHGKKSNAHSSARRELAAKEVVVSKDHLRRKEHMMLRLV